MCPLCRRKWQSSGDAPFVPLLGPLGGISPVPGEDGNVLNGPQFLVERKSGRLWLLLFHVLNDKVPQEIDVLEIVDMSILLQHQRRLCHMPDHGDVAELFCPGLNLLHYVF